MDGTCQIYHIDSMAQQQNVKMKLQHKIKTMLNVIIHILKKGIIRSLEQFLKHLESDNIKPLQKKGTKNSEIIDLKAGDRVKVKSKNEIFDTLDKNHRFQGCAFMEEMITYCGTEQIVYKRINNFFDERLCKFYKAQGIVLLEGIKCSGKLSIAGPICDRSCYLFWKEAWLEKINS